MLSNRDRDPFMPASTRFYLQQHLKNHATDGVDHLRASSNSPNSSNTPSPVRTPNTTQPRSLASPDSVRTTAMQLQHPWSPLPVAHLDETTERRCRGKTIFINGYPGTGKLTVAKELQKILSVSKVFDHHLLIDAARATFAQTDPEYQTLRKAFRATLLESINNASADYASTNWIFTECQSNSHVGTSISHEYLAAAQRRNSPFVSVILTCSLEENLRRLSHHSRKTAPRRKLTNREVLKAIREEEVIHSFGEWIGVRELVIDVSKLEAEEAAVVIKSFLDTVDVETAMAPGAGVSSDRPGKRPGIGGVRISREDLQMAEAPVTPHQSNLTSLAAITSPTTF